MPVLEAQNSKQTKFFQSWPGSSLDGEDGFVKNMVGNTSVMLFTRDTRTVLSPRAVGILVKKKTGFPSQLKCERKNPILVNMIM